MAGKPPKKPTESSEAKSIVAQSKPRIGGRFVSTKNVDAGLVSAEVAKAKKVPTIKKEDVIIDNRAISDEDREAIGTDSKKFFELALKNSRTWYEGAKYAKELKPLQHPSLQAQHIKQDIATELVIKWDWDGTPEGALIEHDTIEDIDSISTDETTGQDS